MDRTDGLCAIKHVKANKPNQIKIHLIGRTVTLEQKEYVFSDNEENPKQILFILLAPDNIFLYEKRQLGVLFL